MKLIFLKKCALKPSTQTAMFQMAYSLWFSANYLLYTHLQNNILFKYLLLSQMSPVSNIPKRFSKNQTSPQYTDEYMAKKVRNKISIEQKKAFLC